MAARGVVLLDGVGVGVGAPVEADDVGVAAASGLLTIFSSTSAPHSTHASLPFLFIREQDLHFHGSSQ